jgi:hypothetical protein
MNSEVVGPTLERKEILVLDRATFSRRRLCGATLRGRERPSVEVFDECGERHHNEKVQKTQAFFSGPQALRDRENSDERHHLRRAEAVQCSRGADIPMSAPWMPTGEGSLQRQLAFDYALHPSSAAPTAATSSLTSTPPLEFMSALAHMLTSL